MVYILVETYFLFEANSIESEEKERANCIAVVGDETYGTLLGLLALAEPSRIPFTCIMTLLGLLAPAEPSGIAFTCITNKLGEHYSPNPYIIVERSKFDECGKSETETRSQYLARLKRLEEYAVRKRLRRCSTNITSCT